MRHKILKTILVSLLVYLTNLICGTLLLVLLGYSNMSEASAYNQELIFAGALWLFVFSLMLGFFWLLPTIIIAFLAITISKKVVKTDKEPVQVFALYCFYLLLVAITYFLLPIMGKQIRTSGVQLAMMLSFELLLAYICFVLLKPGKIGRISFTALNVLLAIALHELSAPSITHHNMLWVPCFFACLYIIPGWYPLYLLSKRWNLLNNRQ